MFRRVQGLFAHQFAVPGHGRFQLRIVRGIQPANASTPAEAGHHQTVRVATVARRPAGNVVEIGQYLRVRHFADQVAEQRRDVAVIIRIALTEIEFRRNGQVTFQRQTAAEVANMFMNAKYFLHHDHDGQRAIGRFWPRVVRWHVLSLGGNGGLACGNGFFRG